MRSWRRLLRPPGWALMLIVVSAATLLALCLDGVIAAEGVHYAAYLYSTYALAAVCAWLPGTVRRGRRRAAALVARFVATRPGFGRVYAVWIDPARRVRSLLVPSLAFNLVYAAFKLGAGVWLRSAWMIGGGFYYAILAGLRYALLRSFLAGGPPDGERDWRTYRTTALLLLLLTLAKTGLIAQTVWFQRAYRYPGVLIYAFALYAFVKIATAATAAIRQRRVENRLLAASRWISLACALMSVLALQTALIEQFGDGDGAFAETANALFGGFVCLSMLCVCGHMLAQYRHHAREQRGETHEQT